MSAAVTGFVERPSPNFDARPEGAPVDMLVMHYTGMPTGDEALQRLTDPETEVSAHYLIEEDGGIFRLVDEAHRAWHAGVAQWRGHRDVNARSIGIELVNPGHEWGYRPFTALQMAALVELARDILARHPIPARNVVGHSDVAPRRKMDPGELFDWRRLAEDGIGLWPEPSATPCPDVMDALAEIGYETAAFAASVAAFQRHFRQQDVHGFPDPDTVRRLAGLVDRCRAAGD